MDKGRRRPAQGGGPYPWPPGSVSFRPFLQTQDGKVTPGMFPRLQFQPPHPAPDPARTTLRRRRAPAAQEAQAWCPAQQPLGNASQGHLGSGRASGATWRSRGVRAAWLPPAARFPGTNRPSRRCLPEASQFTVRTTALQAKAFDLWRGWEGRMPTGASHWCALGLGSSTALPFKRATVALPVEPGAPGPRYVSRFKKRNREGAESECAEPIGRLYSCSDWP